MELKGKNESTSMKLKPKETGSGHQEVVATLKWTAAVDLDLHVYYSPKGAVLQPAKKGFLGIGGSPAKMSGEGTISFRNYGSLTSAPFIKLDKDSGVGGVVAEGGNKETMTITQKGLEAASRIHLLVWDWDQVKVGGPARFADSDAKITVVDNLGTEHDVKLETGAMGNIACIASLEINPTGTKLVNTSSAGLLKKPFVDTDEVLAVLGIPKD